MIDDCMHDDYRSIPQETSELFKKHYVTLPEEAVDESLNKGDDLNLAKLIEEKLANVEVKFDAVIGSTGVISNSTAVAVSKSGGRGMSGNTIDRFEEMVMEKAGPIITVNIPDGARKSLNLLFANSARGLAVRVIVIVGKGAKLSLLEWYTSYGDSPSFSGVVHRLEADENSDIEINALHSERKSTIVASYFSNSAGENAAIRVNSVYIGGSHDRVRNEFNADSHGSSIEANEIVFGSGEQKFDLMSKISNSGAHSRAVLNSGAAMDESSTCFLKGYAKINHGAKLATSNIHQEGLLLSRDSKILALPDMSIDESDVKATHSASAGPLDDDKLFYMMARGIDIKNSKELVTTAFLTKVVSKIRDPVAKELALSMVAKKISDGSFGGLPEIKSVGVWETAEHKKR